MEKKIGAKIKKILYKKCKISLLLFLVLVLIPVVLFSLFYYHMGKSRVPNLEQVLVEEWSKPDQGYLGGVVTEMNFKKLKIRDFDEKEWEVYYNLRDIRSSSSLEIGEKIRILGDRTQENTFVAIEIRSW